MAFGGMLFVVIALIAVVWMFIELKRFRHKFFAVFLVILILFTYLSFTIVLKGQNVDWKTPSGMYEAGKLYFVWLGSLFTNAKSITGHAVNLDWSSNETE